MLKKKYCHFCGKKLTEKYIEGRNRKYCTKCREPIYENPIPATCTIVADSQNRILLVKRNVEPKTGHWCLPGGFMELDETPEEAALRELEEETGIVGKIEMLVGITANPSPMYGTVLISGFLVREFSGDPVAGDDASEVAYFNKDDMPVVAFQSHRMFLRTFFAAYASFQPTNG